MSTISREEVARLAGLARIDLTETGRPGLAGARDVSVESVAGAQEVPAADVPATSHPIPLTNVFRDDVVEAPLTVEQALGGAPEAEDGRFAVPQILGEEA